MLVTLKIRIDANQGKVYVIQLMYFFAVSAVAEALFGFSVIGAFR